MKTKTIYVSLDRLPKKLGGVRYKGMVGSNHLALYFPQDMLRKLSGNGSYPEELKITVGCADANERVTNV